MKQRVYVVREGGPVPIPSSPGAEQTDKGAEREMSPLWPYV